MVDHGVDLLITFQSDTSFSYISELQAHFGIASPRSYVPAHQSFDGSLEALVGGVVRTYGTTAPGATDPFYGEPWIPGDLSFDTSGTSQLAGWRRTSGGVWEPMHYSNVP